MVDTIRAATHFHSTNILETCRSFSHSIAAAAIGQNETFPFVTIPNFEALASGVRSNTGAEMINWHVMVNKSQLEDWSVYSQANHKSHQAEQRATALALKTTSVTPEDFVDDDIAPYPYIPQFDGDKIMPGTMRFAPEYGDGPYFPAWDVSPPPFSAALFNSDPFPWALKSQLGATLERRDIFLSDLTPVGNLAGRAIISADHESYHESLLRSYPKDEENPDKSAFGHPHPGVMVPVFEDINDRTSRLVGAFIVIVPFDRFLINLLPEGVDGITLVLRSSCGKNFTYMLDGNSAHYVGEGDYHDTTYDDTEVVIPFGNYFDETYEPVDGECLYEYFIYSTKEFDDQYHTMLPLTLTLVVALTFALMIVTFVVYDIFVSKRNKQAVDVARKTNAVVTNLFPQQVRDRLLDEATQGKDKKAKLQSFLNGDASVESAPASSPPIADLYDECTVYFAGKLTPSSCTHGRCLLFKVMGLLHSRNYSHPSNLFFLATYYYRYCWFHQMEFAERTCACLYVIGSFVQGV